MSTDAILVLNDGTEFEGEAIGALRQDATGVAVGDIDMHLGTADQLLACE